MRFRLASSLSTVALENRSVLSLGLSIFLLLGLVIESTAQTAIELDGSLANARTDNLVLDQPGPVYTIDQTMGEISGSNLFHSFLDLSVGGGDTAQFTALQPFTNVLARVTGGNASVFNGVLRSSVMNSLGGGANFFLMNPSGILFGANSQIDVPGNLFLSTAQELHFSDGLTLDLVNAPSPVLSMADPTEFGFLGGGPAAEIALLENGTSGFGFLSLSMQPGTTLGIAAGDIRIAGPNGFVFLQAPGGRVGLVAAGAASATIGIDDFDLSTGEPGLLGTIAVEPGVSISGIDLVDPNADQGEVKIRGGRFEISGSDLSFGGNLGPPQPAIDIDVADTIEITGAGAIVVANRGISDGGNGLLQAVEILVDGASSSIISQNAGPGGGGDLELRADSITIGNGGQVGTQVDPLTADPSGQGGDLISTSTNLDVLDGSVSVSANPMAPTGALVVAVDDIRVEGSGSEISSVQESTTTAGGFQLGRGSGSIRVLDGGLIASQTLSSGAAADLAIDTGLLRITDGGRVETSTIGNGNAGFIEVTADRVEIGRTASLLAPGFLASSVALGASGMGGDIRMTVTDLVVSEGGQITTTTRGNDAGDVTIDATGDVLLLGDDGIETPSGIFARAESAATGSSGNVTINAQTITIEDGAEISTRSLGNNDSGTVTLVATDSLVVRAAGQAGSLVTAPGIDGDGGDVTLSAPEILLDAGASVDVTSSGSGTGGTLFVNAENLNIQGMNAAGTLASQLAAEATSTGSAGGISISLDGSLSLSENARINARSTGSGSAGDIIIIARNATMNSGAAVEALATSTADAGSIEFTIGRELSMRSSAITTESRAASGGQVSISAGDRIDLGQSTITTSVATGTLNGGDLALSAPFVILNDSDVIARAFAGNGGAIQIDTNLLVASSTSLIDASSVLGIDGPIFQSVPNADLSGQLAELTEEFFDAADQLERNCGTRTDRAGSFVVRPYIERLDSIGEVLNLEAPSEDAIRDDGCGVR